MAAPRTHVVFDLDGTLLDTERLYTQAFEAVLRPYGAVFTMGLKRRIMGGDTLSGATLTVSELGLPMRPEAFVSAIHAALRGLFPRLQPMKGAVALVSALQQRGVPMALATSGHRHLTEDKLALHPFLKSIEVVVCGDDPRLKRAKPAPDIFLLAAADLGVEPTRCVAFEDSAHGVEAAATAGMHTFALVEPSYGFDQALFSRAAKILTSLEDILPDDFLDSG